MTTTLRLAAALVGGLLVSGSASDLSASSNNESANATVPRDPAHPPVGHDQAFYTFGVAPFVADYAPPEPGTYKLPPIRTVSDHPLVDATGTATTLEAALGGRMAVVSFIYGSCAEATGCPMSTAVLYQLDSQLIAQKNFGRDVALLTISFDPERDTPERLAQMQSHRAAGSDWRFLTAKDQAALQPLLDDFGQTVTPLRYPDGTWTGVYRHVLKVYLLDGERRVRNIYGAGFLDPRVVANDLKTLQIERAR